MHIYVQITLIVRDVSEFLVFFCKVTIVTGLNLQVRSKFQHLVVDSRCIQSYECPDILCEDKSCELPDNACVNWCKIKGLVWISSPSAQRYCSSLLFELSYSECLSSVYCNWDQSLCNQTSLQMCQEMCTVNKSNSFCGLCENGQDCSEFSSISNETLCTSGNVCLLPNGTIALGLSDSECTSYGKCSHPCPPTCESSVNALYSDGVCFTVNYDTSTSCQSNGGSWNPTLSICYYPQVSQSMCGVYGGIFQGCSNLSSYQCVTCQNG
jgi:hypothetical protein